MLRQKQTRQMRSFRLDNKCAERLKELSGQLGASQGELIEELIGACYDSARIDFDIQGFEDFARRCKEAKEKMQARRDFGEALEELQKLSVKNGTDKMTMEEIDAEISAYRRENPKSPMNSKLKDMMISLVAEDEVEYKRKGKSKNGKENNG